MPPRIRTIKPEMWDSQRLGKLSILARLTFVGLISLADDDGRGRAGVRFLLGRIHPYAPDVTEGAFLEAIKELTAENPRPLVVFYQADGDEFYYLPGWDKHQYIEKPKPSDFPKPKSNSPLLPLLIPSDSPLDKDRDRDKDRENSNNNNDVSPEPEPAPASGPAVLTFPTVGNLHSWELFHGDVNTLSSAFPALDILAECRKALAWIQSNPRNKKTPGGMKRFLFSWMSRCQNSRRNGGFNVGVSQRNRNGRDAGLAAPVPGKYASAGK